MTTINAIRFYDANGDLIEAVTSEEDAKSCADELTDQGIWFTATAETVQFLRWGQ